MKFKLCEDLVRRIQRNYIRNQACIKNDHKKNRQHTWKYSKEHVRWIEDFITNNRSKYFTIQMIRDSFNHHFKPLFKASQSTIRRIMITKLGMVHKKMKKSNPKWFEATHQRQFCKWLILTLKLMGSGVELIWIDEFSLQARNNNLYGWWRKGNDRWVKIYPSSFSMSFVVAFSSRKFYGIIGTSETFNSIMFGYFINELVRIIKSEMDLDSRDWMLVMDNASIHKSLKIKSIIKGRRIRMMFITPYEPSLNPAEKLIMAIKAKLKVREFHGHSLSLASVRGVIEQLVHTNFERLINASLMESMNKMKTYVLL